MDWKTLVGFTVLFHGILYAWKRQWILRMDTTKLNGWINGMGHSRMRKYFRLWFRLGSYVTIIVGFPFTVWLFLRTIFIALTPTVISMAATVTPSSLFMTTEQAHAHAIELHHEQLSPYPDAEIPIGTSSSSYLAIQPILPGWNLPLSHLPYYLLAILISVVIHELGHAVASASHRIPIMSMGVSLFGPLIPTAHVELNSTQLRDTTFKKQMDILTAGVWMNMYLALITYFVVPKLLPAILFPTHTMGTGLVVTGVMQRSGAGGPSGLERGDVIIGIEHCHVEDLNSWLSCLENIWESEPVGYCLNSENVAKYANNSENPACCGPEGDTSPTHLCFMQMNSGGTTQLQEHQNVDSSSPGNESLILRSVIVEKPVLVTTNHSENSSSFSSPPQSFSFCLPAKPVVTENGTSSPNCYPTKYSCSFSIATEQDEDSEPNHQPKTHCYLPRIVKQYETFRTVQIHRRQSTRKESVLFVGDVRDLASGVSTSEYIPRDWFVSRLLGFAKFSVIPVELETVLLLTAGLSAGLAVVNMLPIYGLDGYHVVDAIVRVIVGKRWESREISRLVNIISWVALAVALLTVFCSIVSSF